MYYLNARYYAPSVAGFITQDSYRGTYEDPKTWNLYAYCAGNPVGYTDPTGHFWDTVLGIYGALDSIKNFIEDPSWGKGGLAVVDTLAAIVPIVPGTGGVRAVKKGINAADNFFDAKKAVEGTSDVIDATQALKYTTGTPNEVGKIGEKLAGIKKNTKNYKVDGRDRIPDGVTKEFFQEVKNVKKLSLTKQLKDTIELAKKKGKRVELFVRPSTKLTQPLIDAINDNKIVVRELWKQSDISIYRYDIKKY